MSNDIKVGDLVLIRSPDGSPGGGHVPNVQRVDSIEVHGDTDHKSTSYNTIPDFAPANDESWYYTWDREWLTKVEVERPKLHIDSVSEGDDYIRIHTDVFTFVLRRDVGWYVIQPHGGGWGESSSSDRGLEQDFDKAWTKAMDFIESQLLKDLAHVRAARNADIQFTFAKQEDSDEQ